ncbi:MAG TPA: helicase HerA-like domain-containing protein [Gaiellaceae bacterium]|nr:helicase HerA-like domain-containing protein [Gaiellaceae bacterium]
MLSPDLGLPVDVAGEAIAILAKRGAGKTTTARVLVEELRGCDVQTVILDPVGAWWGLRSSADGRSAGLSLPVLGGAHGDVPLEATAGRLIADVVVDTGQSAVIDLSDFSKTQQRQFVVDFAERLYLRKARERTLLHVVLEEADEFVPQRVSAGDARMVGAIEQLVRRGRGRGIGLTMISQRSASLNKAVLEQADVLVAMRTTGPRDRAAIEAWVSKQDVDGADEVLPSLPSLETGEAWVWNPERALLRRVRIRRSRTFDSSQTPKAGEARVAPKEVAAIDLAALGEQIAATAERAKENDPAELRRQIRDLKGELARRPTERETVEVEKVIEVPMLSERERALLEKTARRFDELMPRVESLVGVLDSVKALLERVAAHGEQAAPAAVRPSRPVAAQPVARPPARPTPSPRPDGDARVSGPQQKILDALAWFAAIGVSTPKRTVIAALAGVSPKSSGFEKNLSTLRTAGLIDYPAGGRLALTGDGDAAAARPASMPSDADLHAAIFTMVSGPQASILRDLIDHYPTALSRDAIAASVGVSPSSSGFEKNLSTLRSFELVDYPERGFVVALPILFPSEGA